MHILKYFVNSEVKTQSYVLDVYAGVSSTKPKIQ